MGRTELVAQKHQGKESNVATDIAQTALPPIVSREEWQAARDALLVKEKAHTRAKDALSAERRRLPMVEVDGNYPFDGPEGERTLRRVVRRPAATDRPALHVPSRLGQGLPGLHCLGE